MQFLTLGVAQSVFHIGDIEAHFGAFRQIDRLVNLDATILDAAFDMHVGRVASSSTPNNSDHTRTTQSTDNPNVHLCSLRPWSPFCAFYGVGSGGIFSFGSRGSI